MQLNCALGIHFCKCVSDKCGCILLHIIAIVNEATAITNFCSSVLIYDRNIITFCVGFCSLLKLGLKLYQLVFLFHQMQQNLPRLKSLSYSDTH